MKDSVFLRAEKVPMTKREVRAVVLERLELEKARRFADIGAGTGSVAIEAALRFPQLTVTAVERTPAAADIMQKNMQELGCQQVVLIRDVAPCTLESGLDAIFIGGSGGNLEDIIQWALERLMYGGRLVMTFILHDNLHEALTYLQHCPVKQLDCVQLLASSMTPLGSSYYFKPNNPTFIVSCIKGS
ncbi:cobalt-precorrin-6Y C(15)-methyltransferase [Vibrio sp. HA2012]|uniref:decarboxylating cobalt-precorrin-6B (C(15))-methyltransferase n=1 Tax=Vibrio sp. HA2012 TaxID=1971595 RepID=UPI000C2B5AF3|nr:decarboxylating cobalt-precorrin-6B (C(15))-methyltransferase [Vibrio sp. HA2012]PJC87397.1 cobalt-precorrin-6Y C(15)-methyltransferase [Vibrio sp. HA2012]